MSTHTAVLGSGARYAPAVAGLVELVYQCCVETKTGQAWFFTREGYFYSRAFRARFPDGGPAKIEPQLLHVSRLSTFAATCTRPLRQTVERILAQYPKQNCAAFFTSLRINLHAVTPILNRQSATLATLVSDIDFDEPVLEDYILSHAAAERQALLSYLDTAGFIRHTQVVICDIGWRGSIQDNLARLLPDMVLNGVYCGLLPRLNPPPPNSIKRALIADLEQDPSDRARWRLLYALPFEMAADSVLGSTIGYEAGAPIVAESSRTPVRYFEVINKFQTQCLAALHPIAEDEPEGAIHWTERARVLAAWDQMLMNPPRQLLEALCLLNHDETFGLGTPVPYARAITWPLLAKAFLFPSARGQIHMVVANLPWTDQLIFHRSIPLPLRTYLVVRWAYRKLIGLVSASTGRK